MAIRVDVLPDCKIEVLRITETRISQLVFDDRAKAMRIIEYLLKRDLRQARKDRFVPQLDRECKRLLIEEINNRR